MADIEEQRFQLLMSEKQFAETQIGGFFDLHVKVLTFLGAAIVLLGWLYSDRAKPLGDFGVAAISISVVVVGCSVILQAIVLYGSSLGYMEYKMDTLNREFMRVLHTQEPVFTALWKWRHSSTQPPVTLSALALFATHVVISVVLLANASARATNYLTAQLAVIGASIYLVITVGAELLIFRAIRILTMQGVPARDHHHHKRDAASDGTE